MKLLKDLLQSSPLKAFDKKVFTINFFCNKFIHQVSKVAESWQTSEKNVCWMCSFLYIWRQAKTKNEDWLTIV